MAYTPDASNSSQPTDDVKASTAAAEFRALKAALQAAIIGVAVPFDPAHSRVILSTPGGSANLTFSSGRVADSTNALVMSYAGGVKTTAAWLEGTGVGGLDTGVIANNTWYHEFIIRRPDTGLVDAIYSLNPAIPALPANYTQFKRIGSAKTDGAAQWTRFVQTGNIFEWFTPILDAAVNNPGVAAVSRTLTVPSGVAVLAKFHGGITNNAAAVFPQAYFSSLDTADLAPSSTVAPLSSANYTANNAGGTENSFSTHCIRTNTAAQIRTRTDASDANCTIKIATLGWIDLEI